MLNRLIAASAVFLFLSSNVNAAPVATGAAAPNFSLPALEGSAAGAPVSLESFKGKVVYLDFWASWCGPCRVSLPILDGLHKQYSELGFEVVAVNIDEELSDALGFLEQFPVSYSVLLDPSSSAPGVYEPQGMPTAYLIDKNGVVRDVHTGFTKGDEVEIEAKIKKLLAE